MNHRPVRRNALTAFLAALLLWGVHTARADMVKHSNPPTPEPGGTNFAGWIESSHHAGSITQLMASGWVNNTTDGVDRIHWWGGYRGWTGANPPPGAPTQFRMHMWTHNSGGGFPAPHLVIWTTSVSSFSAAYEAANADPRTTTNTTNSIFRYEADIPPGLAFMPDPNPGTIYWLSIGAIDTNLAPAHPWGWLLRRHPMEQSGPDRAVLITEPHTPGTTNILFLAGAPVEGDESRDGAFTLLSISPPTEDFGDAPASYGTTLAGDGARHTVDGSLALGGLPDTEADGVPSAGADGDDLAGSDDEDGIQAPDYMVLGSTFSATATVTASGTLNVWVDFDRNGNWADPGDHAVVDYLATPGQSVLSFNVPPSASMGLSYMRFRLSAAGGLSPIGAAANGEVEDYAISITNQPPPPGMDFGDAPDTYHTLLSNDGARHTKASGLFLGAAVDEETNGIPTAAANGDDLAGNDDEDGVVFVDPLLPNVNANVEVVASMGGGFLSAWIDYDRDGVWTSPGERIAANQPLSAGTNTIVLIVPSAITSGPTLARFRLSTATDLTPQGAAPDGEVEDHVVLLRARDFGDAPSQYPVLLNADGARHLLPSALFMGTAPDSESDGQPAVGADGDDSAGTDDEDGATFSALALGGQGQLTVEASAAGRVNAWIDFNNNGSWAEAGERIATNVAVTAGVNTVSFAVPADAVIGTVFARVRIASAALADFTGEAADGEVEDHAVTVTQAQFDFGDAPASYPVTLAADGARHRLPTALRLGLLADIEADGQPQTAALGDDLSGQDDEDGVSFSNPVLAGEAAELRIVASAPGLLNAWIDYDSDRFWGGAGERIATNRAVAAGTNLLSFPVPANVATGTVFVRVRLSSAPLTNFTGEAADGEVEDHAVTITATPEFDWGDAPAGFPVTLAEDGARHAQPSALHLGLQVDDEADGQTSAAADGDDAAGVDDEDGVDFPQLVPGGLGRLTVTASGSGLVNAWIDLNASGGWGDAGERVAANVAVTAGVNILSFPVPANAATGTVFARVRISTATLTSFSGGAADGEVEDHAVLVAPLAHDFGDAPAGFPVLLADDGARHRQPSALFIGNQVDIDSDGVPSSGADGDDTQGVDDEDGVTFPAPTESGNQAVLRVTASATGLVSAWVDFDHNLSWTGVGEQIATNIAVTAGVNNISFPIPVNALTGAASVRVRASTSGVNNFTGEAADGEVEDHFVTITAPLLDFGDAPASFPVLLTSDGARHAQPSALRLGTAVDGELDGAPSASADGDDLAGIDDEDGVTLSSPLRQGETGVLSILASASGLLNAWIDFDASGSWSESNNQIAGNLAVTAGINTVQFSIPANSATGVVFVRVRISSNPLTGPTGATADGEVEDLPATISRIPFDFGDAPTSFPVRLALDGARHQVVTGVHLGELIDDEADGQPSANATGDDLAGDDEDGVLFPAVIPVGQLSTARVTVSVSGFLSGWLDVNSDGDWNDNGEHIWQALAVTAGVNAVAIAPLPLNPGLPLAFRARFSTVATDVLAFTGAASGGEVEDYIIVAKATDWGDAPAPFPTTTYSDGARHLGPSALRLGAAWDGELEALPTAAADGDDLDGADDEDGVTLPNGLFAGATNIIRVTASAPGLLNAWLDLTQDQTWTNAADRVFSNVAVVAGANDLELVLPADAPVGAITARFRLSTVTNLSFTGEAPDGEVEDYRLTAQALDFGDAPESFPVLEEDDAARHIGPSALFLGAAWDAETNGQPSVTANGDDNAGAMDDEDGVTAPNGLFSGLTNIIRVVASAPGVLNAWMDLDASGDWEGAGEHVLSNQTVAAGTNDIAVTLPNSVPAGALVGRFRLSTATNLTVLGLASDGEVEDHAFAIAGLDFGDAPATYPVTLADDGARHQGPSDLRLGVHWDGEGDGQANPAAIGDDINGGPDDEDGVTVPAGLRPGATSIVRVVASAPGILNAWMDLDRDGSWSGAERVFTNAAVVAGTNDLSVRLPPALSTGTLFARFRLSTASGLQPTGAAADGEVEDHRLFVQNLDFGDAPATFPVTLAQDGARHLGPSSLFLGAVWDDEADGQPGAASTGDDLNGAPDDEDGVTVTGGLVAGATNALEVSASGNGFLNAWFDLDRNGTWSPAEHLLTNVPVSAGANAVPLTLPAGTVAGSMPARFRLSTAAGLGVTGLALDGEVEDHALPVQGYDLGDAPSLYPVTLAQDGARHLGPSSLFLGANWDGEADGQPSAGALGDDANGVPDDEDGVELPAGLAAGATNTIRVTASAIAYLNVWVDLNGNGNWTDPGEHLHTNFLTTAGDNDLPVYLPPTAPATVVARLRISSVVDLAPTGAAPDGEVEDHAWSATLYDYGDAPATYPVAAAQNGARHLGPSSRFLGSAWDGEGDGQPSAGADADDLSGAPDDEDGVSLPTGLNSGAENPVQVVASTSGVLSAWFDLDRDGSWQSGEQLINNAFILAGTNLVGVTIPANITSGAVVARFRFSSAPGLSVDGTAPDGEVEDHVFTVQALDFGDAPAPRPVTLAEDGARHGGPSALYLGAAWDADADGQPSADADADDSNGSPDDEDGVSLAGALALGQTNTALVVASGAGVLNAWFDYDRNGSWADAGEHVISNVVVAAGLNSISLPASVNLAETGPVFTRFRLSTLADLTPTGYAPDGEVEDHRFDAVLLDHGDAPGTFPVSRQQDGARHVGPSALFLGANWDGELDGAGSDQADADDLNGGPDDEDGVSLPVPLRAGTTTNAVLVLSSASGFLSVWLDLDRNGAWGPGEQVVTDAAVTAGVNAVSIALDETVLAGTLVARFRLSTAAGLAPTGEAPDGEVEDHLLGVTESFTRDYGDAPAPFPTLAADNGAAHIVSTSLRLGATVDVEVDGQPEAQARGDDANGAADDEDGVTFPGTWLPGATDNLIVTASANGLLNAWFDLNGNGSWGEAGEQIAIDLPLVPGPNVLGVTIPPSAAIGPAFARFRFSTDAGLGPTGVAADGEVEDYQTVISQPAAGVTTPEMTAITRAGTATVLHVVTGASGFYQLQATTNLLLEEAGWKAKSAIKPAPINAFTNADPPAPLEAFRVVAPYVE